MGGACVAMRAKTAVLVFAFGVLSGCATYTAKPIDPDVTARSLSTRRLDDAALLAALASVKVDQRRSSDVTRLTWTALYHAPDVEAARARWRVARAAAITAGARPNPQLELSAEIPRASSEEPWTRGLSVGVPIETAGKRGARIAQAVADAERARFELHATAWTQRGRVVDALINLDGSTTPLDDAVRIQRERVALMQRRVELGVANAADLTHLRLDERATETQLAEAQQRRAEARAELAAALAVPVEALSALESAISAIDLPAPEALPSLELQRSALTSRPDVSAALAAYAASEAALRLEAARQYPDVTLGPGLLWDAGVAKWTLAASLVLPLFDRNQGPIAEANARRQVAAAEVLKAQSSALAELDRARASYVSAYRGRQSAAARVTQAERLLASAQRALRVGTGTRSDMLAAELEARQAGADAEHWRIDALHAFAALEAAQRLALLDPPFDVERLDAFPLAEDAMHD